MAKGIKITLPVFRVSWPNVFKPRLNKLSGKQEYSLTCLFDKATDLSLVKNAIKQAVIDEWGADPAKWPKTKEGANALKLPLKQQGLEKDKEGKIRLGYVEGAEFVVIKSYDKPGLVSTEPDPDAPNKPRVITDETEFYPGCYARATVAVKAFNMDVNKGVSIWVHNIQKVKEGEPLGGRSSPQTDFAPIEGLENAPVGGATSDQLFQ